MDWLITFFRHTPLIPVFLTLGLGFWLGKLRIGSFTLGSVAATLIVGVVIGQMHIEVPDILKNTFFLFFLFCTGYSVGPQFFHSLRGPGSRQALFAVVAALVCAGIVLAAAKIMGYNHGIATGLFAGSQTVSACLGMVSDTVREMPADESMREYLLMIIPGCYAVTYVFGTIGTVWYLSSMAPRTLGGLRKVQAEVAAIEQAMDGGPDAPTVPQPGQIRAASSVSFRAYEASSAFLDSPRTVAEIEQYLSQGDKLPVYVERARCSGQILDPTDASLISKGDHLVLAGRLEAIVDLHDRLGPEITDPELLNFSAEKTPVTVASHSQADGATVASLRALSGMQRVMIASIRRNGMAIPLKNLTVLHPGDVITLVGWPRDVAGAAHIIGYADPQTGTTDIVFVALGLAAGCILGALAIKVKGIPVSLGLSVGSLIAGLVLGWLRNRTPTFGRIPAPVIWLFDNLGINMFIAIIGLSAGASFMRGLHEAGLWIFLVGAVCTILGLIINVFIARRIFRFTTPEVLGSVAGARCSVAAIGAIRETLGSDVPNISFTVTYAVANITLVFSALFLLFI